MKNATKINIKVVKIKVDIMESNSSIPSNSNDNGKDISNAFKINPTFLLSQLNKFLALASPYSGTDRWGSSYNRNERNALSETDEATATNLALFLLRNLPPARPAALSFLAQVLSKEVSFASQVYFQIIFYIEISFQLTCIYIFFIIPELSKKGGYITIG